MPRKPITIGALLAIAALALGTVYFGWVSHRSSTMEQIQPQGNSIPPIDASAPAHTETATFALG
jgi:hypothetical protein